MSFAAPTVLAPDARKREERPRLSAVRTNATPLASYRSIPSRFWKSSFDERRCVVPATSFCEPNRDMLLLGDQRRPFFKLLSALQLASRCGTARNIYLEG